MQVRKLVQPAVLALCLAGYVWLGYFTARNDFTQLAVLYFALFGLYFWSLRVRLFQGSFKYLLGAAMLLRLSLLVMTPNLTDDYFRFIWDGLFTAAGQNPYLVMPSSFISGPQTVPGITDFLYQHLNSQNYYTVYPPVSQFIYGLSARVCGAAILPNIIMMRLFILLAELGNILFIHKLADAMKLSDSAAAIYAFNPLVVMELTGNLHFEAVMLFFMVMALYLLIKNRWHLSALGFGLAAGTKLLPLIFLPLLIRRLGWRRSLAYFAIVGLTLSMVFVPFINAQLIPNFASGLDLYFQKFEFNASLYYIARWIGYLITGYNTIAVTGVLLALISLITIILIAAREKSKDWGSLFSSMLFCGTAYYLCATTVHPWYITTLVLLSSFTRYRYPLVWSMLIVLSYAAYRIVPYAENQWLVAVEYTAVSVWIIYEVLVQPRLKATGSQPRQP